jgi:hypothetical protein
LSITQPDKVHLQEVTDPQWGQALELLKVLRVAFERSAADFNSLLTQAQQEGVLAAVSG